MIEDLEASVRILAVSLETAQTNVGDVLIRLEGHRVQVAESPLVAGPGSQPTRVGGVDADRSADEDEIWTSPEVDEDAVAPLTATEAYLRSAQIDFGDPPLPPLDDAEVAARYGRDAARGTGTEGADAQIEDRVETGDTAATPLGWLFRGPS